MQDLDRLIAAAQELQDKVDAIRESATLRSLKALAAQVRRTTNLDTEVLGDVRALVDAIEST